MKWKLPFLLQLEQRGRGPDEDLGLPERHVAEEAAVLQQDLAQPHQP
jgi:hypothetical protein